MDEQTTVSDKNRQLLRLIVVYVFTFSVLLVAVVSIYLGINYYFDDGMSYRLSEYTITRNEETVREYLLAYRGEADGHNDAIVFLAWGISNQKDFIRIVESVDSTKKVHLCERLGAAAMDTGQVDKFEIAFQGNDSECLEIIRSEIERHRGYIR